MQNIKYHLINITSVLLFSYLTAASINQIIKYNISPVYNKNVKKSGKVLVRKIPRNYEYYNKILDSGFFPKVDAVKVVDDSADKQITAGIAENLTLMGTITGPGNIAMAMILKKGEKEPEIFKLWSSVYGLKLIAILENKVYLKTNEGRVILELYGKMTEIVAKKPKETASSDKVLKQNFSRSEIKQNVLNNLDNAMKGLVAGPHRSGDTIDGFELKTVRPYNILYKLGARSGDVVKRINGHVLDSTEKLYKLWEAVKNEPKLSIDIDRGTQPLTLELNMTD